MALPVSLAGLIAVPLGGGRRVGRLNRSLAQRLLGTPTDAEQATGRRRRLLWHWLTALPADLLAFAIVAPVWGVFLTRGVLYPLFGADNLEQSWGGPTLAGAWFVHFIQGPPLLLVVTLVLWPVSRLQAARARKAP